MKGITEFIETIAPRLPEFYYREDEYIFDGATLMLCGHRWAADGDLIKKNGLYPVKGPAKVMYPSHLTAMKRAFLSRGATGVLKYLEPFIEPAEMQHFREQFLIYST